MTLHHSTFEYLNPTELQKEIMARVRIAFANCAAEIDGLIPDGADKTYVMRHFRECAMWANVAITRNPDGTPRK